MAVFMFIYIVMNFRLSDWSSDIVVLLYTYVFLGCYACATGYIGVWASYKFVSKIYKNIRTD